jgi:hypothetical protein
MKVIKPSQADKESEIKSLGILIKEAGTKAKLLKQEALDNHFAKLNSMLIQAKHNATVSTI